MITLKELESSDLLEAMEEGEFSEKIRTSAALVVIILSQGWCGEWKILYKRLQKVAGWDQSHRPDIDIWWVLYDRLSIMENFMEFKERAWKNKKIPYLRYYREGKLVDTSNFVMEKELFAILGA